MHWHVRIERRVLAFQLARIRGSTAAREEAFAALLRDRRASDAMRAVVSGCADERAIFIRRVRLDGLQLLSYA